MPSSLLWWIPLLPFLGFLINGTLGRKLPRAAVAGIALLFTALPALLVGWLWMTMLRTGDLVMQGCLAPVDSDHRLSCRLCAHGRSP